MPRQARIALVALLLALVAVLELRLTWSTLVFIADPGAAHAWLPVNDVLTVHTRRGGLEPDDRLVSVGGRPVASRADSYRALLEHRLRSRVEVEVIRSGTRLTTWTTAEPRSTRLGWLGKVYVVMVNILTPWFCLLLGLFVVWRRPMDPLAWWMLLILAGQAQINSFLYMVDGWPPFWSLAMRFFHTCSALEGVGWLWFGLDFPNRATSRKLWPVLRWPLTLGVLFVSAWVGVRNVSPEFPAASTATQIFVDAVPGWFWNGVVRTAILFGFANLVYRRVLETLPDQRRRLNLLLWGWGLGRGPLMVMQLIAALAGVNLGDDRFFAIVSMLMLLVIVLPATFAYALVVQRAMDVGVVVRQGLQYALARRSVDVARLLFAAAMIATLVSLSYQPDASWWTRYGMLASFTAILLGMEPVLGWLRGWIDRQFFRNAVEGERLLAGLSDEFRRESDPGAVVASLTTRIRQALHAETVEAALGEGGQAPGGVELAIPIRAGERKLGTLWLGPKRSEEPYSDREIGLLETVAQQAGLALENAELASVVAHEAAQRERLQQELEIAREVQMRLLPKREPEVPGLETAGACRPAQSIGGDYYDYLVFDNGTLGAAIADVAGKGVPAALLVSNLQAALRGLAADSIRDVPALVARLNQLVYDSTPSNRFITFSLGVFDPGTRRWTFTTAGHNPAALLRAEGGEVEWLRTKGLALGLKRRAPFLQHEVMLAPGDLLVLYTDGVTEAVNPAGQEFGEALLAEALVRHRALGVAALRDALVGEVDAFANSAPQHDDMTLVVLRVK